MDDALRTPKLSSLPLLATSFMSMTMGMLVSPISTSA